jgi:hypothetical protein
MSPYLGVNLVARVHGALATDHRLTGLAQAKSKKRAKLFAKEQVLQQDLHDFSGLIERTEAHKKT